VAGGAAVTLTGSRALGLTVAALLILVPATALRAQPDTTAVLTARIVDNAGAPVADAEVFVVQLDRRVRTGSDGVFVVRPVQPGRYDIGVRRLGYLPRSAQLLASAQPTREDIQIVAFTTRLAPVVTAASRGGLSGVVSDTALRPLARALVRPAGSGRTVRTDSAGRFFIALKPGNYLVGVERDSFARQTLAVTIPKDSGREIAVWLSPRDQTKRAEAIMEEVRIFDLDRRMIRSARQSSHYFTRDQLLALGITDMSRLARRWANGSITADCVIDVMNDGGRPYRVPLNSVETESVEFVELYQTSSVRRTNGTAPFCGHLRLMIWLRR
jgi:hypothetical protein